MSTSGYQNVRRLLVQGAQKSRQRAVRLDRVFSSSRSVLFRPTANHPSVTDTKACLESAQSGAPAVEYRHDVVTLVKNNG